MVPASHSSAPIKKPEDHEADRPEHHKTERPYCDPAGPAEIVDAINEGHRRTYVNVTYIHIGRPARLSSVSSANFTARRSARDRADRSAPPASSKSSARHRQLRRPASPRANSEAMPCDSAQICRLIISAGGRLSAGMRAHSASDARRSTANARSDAWRSPGRCRAARPPRTSPSNRPARCAQSSR